MTFTSNAAQGFTPFQVKLTWKLWRALSGKKSRPRERNKKEQGQVEGRKETKSKHTFECYFNKCTAWKHFSFFSFPFCFPRRKPIEGQDCVVLALPCVQGRVLLHSLEEVIEQLDSKLSKSKPHPVIYGCCKVCRAYRILLRAQEKSSGAASAPELPPMALGRVCASIPLLCRKVRGEQPQTRADSNPSPSWAPGSSIISIEIQSNAE